MVASNIEVVKLLLAKGANVNAKNKYGETPLMYACYQSSEKQEILLAHGADANAKDNKGYTVLMVAAKEGRLGAVAKLLEGGSDIHAQDHKGATALSLASELNQTKVIELLKAQGAKY